MGEIISIYENGIYLIIEVSGDRDVRFIHFSSMPFEAETMTEYRKKWCRLVEIQVAGENHDTHQGSKHIGTIPGLILKYKDHKDYDGA